MSEPEVSTAKPDPDVMRRAIDTYVRIAYPGKDPPVTVRSMIATQRNWKGKYFDGPTFVKDRAIRLLHGL